jgi:hypothetical protein
MAVCWNTGLLDDKAASSMTCSTDEIADTQRLMQQTLGRCLLRIQQYEKLLKTMLARSQLQGPSIEIGRLQEERTASVQSKTLGQLIRLLTDEYLVTREPQNSDSKPCDLDEPGWFRLQSRMLITEERYLETVSALREFVSLRNVLVHHFIGRFDLWSLEGCTQAQAFLEESYESVAGHHLELIEWAKSMNAACIQLGSAVLDCVDGLGTDGSVAWPQNGLTDSLLDAEEAIAQDGWTSLLDAIKWCAQHHPAQTLRRYRCASWREVIHKSGLFQIRKSSDAGTGMTLIHFRSHPIDADDSTIKVSI